METKVSVSLVYIHVNALVFFLHLHGELRERLHLHCTLLPTLGLFREIDDEPPLETFGPSRQTRKAEDMIALPSSARRDSAAEISW